MNQLTNDWSARVEAIVRSAIDTTAVELTPRTDLLAECHIDSLDALRLALRVETEFGVEFEQDDLANFRTIADIVLALESRAARIAS